MFQLRNKGENLMPTNKTLEQFIEECPHKEVCICPTCKTALEGCEFCYELDEYVTTVVTYAGALRVPECDNYKRKGGKF